MEGFCRVLALFVCVAVIREFRVEAAVTFTTPAGGDAAAGSPPAENAAVGTTVETLVATGETAPYTYAIVSQDGVAAASATLAFSLTAAVLKTAVTLDYEVQNSYKLIITASDSSSPAVVGTCTVTVMVTDVDDNAPVGPSSAICVSRPATSVQNAFIANVMGYLYDADASKAMRFPNFEISAGDDAGSLKFQIDDDSLGTVTRTAVALDAATKDTYALTILAKGPTNTGTVILQVKLGGSCSGAPSVVTSVLAGVACITAFILF